MKIEKSLKVKFLKCTYKLRALKEKKNQTFNHTNTYFFFISNKLKTTMCKEICFVSLIFFSLKKFSLKRSSLNNLIFSFVLHIKCWFLKTFNNNCLLLSEIYCKWYVQLPNTVFRNMRSESTIVLSKQIYNDIFMLTNYLPLKQDVAYH